jgi:hypothetical protein
MTIINEGLDYHDFKGQISPVVTVDEYSAKMGEDSDVVTLAFKMNSKLAAEDLVSWLERGYDYILDAAVSDGQITPSKYLVFAEMNRRTTVPEKIIEILEDLKTLTDLSLDDYKIVVNEQEHKADPIVLKQAIILSPLEYKKQKEKEEELNEMRDIAGLSVKPAHDNDTYIKNLKAMAGM